MHFALDGATGCIIAGRLREMIIFFILTQKLGREVTGSRSLRRDMTEVKEMTVFTFPGKMEVAILEAWWQTEVIQKKGSDGKVVNS